MEKTLGPRIESWKNLEENPWKMSILSFNGFGSFLKKGSKKEELWKLRRISRFWQIRPLFINWAYCNVEGRIGRSGPHETCE